MDRQKKIIRTSGVGIAANTLLVVFKLIVGFLTGSIAIISDALNNLADAGSSLVTILGAKLAAKPPDKEHPYGYGQIEYLSSVLIAVVILYTGVSSCVDSVKKILDPTPVHYDVAAVVVIAAGIAVKLFLGRYFKMQGKTVRSEALIASGADASLDALVSASILVGAAVTVFAHVVIDGWLGAGISILIIKSGLDVLKASVSRIVGERVPAATAKELTTPHG